MPNTARRALGAIRHPRLTARWLIQRPAVRAKVVDSLQRVRVALPTRPTLSVIVPVYNTEAYVADTLESIAKSTFIDLEVVIVDDGSTDGSPQIIAEFARKMGRRAQVVTQQNAGLAAARNAGVEAARGTYITFVDSDDLVPTWAYRAMVGTLKRTGSDFVAGGMVRMRRGHRITPKWNRELHGRDRLRQTLQSFPEAIYDVFAPNKVFRRDFWDEAGLRFTEGKYYEDQIPSAEAYLKARTFDFLKTVTYFWVIRTEGGSITQNAADLKNLADRHTVQKQVSELLDPATVPAARAEWLSRRILGNDISLYSRELDRSDNHFWTMVREWLTDIFRESDWESLAPAIPSKRVLAWLIVHADRSTVEEFVAYERDNPGGAPTELTPEGVFSCLPFRGDQRIGVPDELYRIPESQLSLDSSLRNLTWVAPRTVQVKAWAHIRNLDLGVHETKITMVLVGEKTGTQVEFATEPTTGLRVSERMGSAWLPYDPSGFVAQIDLDKVPPSELVAGSSWRMEVRVETAGLVRQGPVQPPLTHGGARYPDASDCVDGLIVIPTWDDDDSLSLGLHARVVQATSVDLSGGVLRLAGRVSPPRQSGTGRLVLTGVPGGVATTERSDVTVASDGGFEASIRVPETSAFVGTVPWTVTAQFDGAEHRVCVVDGTASMSLDPSSAAGWRRTQRGNLAVISGAGTVLAREVAVENGDLVVRGSVVGGSLEVLSLIAKRAELAGEVTSTGARFEARIPLSSDPWGFGTRPAPLGEYQFQAWVRQTGKDAQVQPVERKLWADRTLVAQLPFFADHAPVRIAMANNRRLGVEVLPPLAEDEVGKFHQGRLQRDVYHPLVASGERTDTVLFESFKGQSASCNPLALSNELARRKVPLRLVWSVTDPSVVVPDGVETVIRFSEDWYRLLATSRYLVNNNNWPSFFRKGEGQTYLQTWHGTALKHIGHDIHRILFSYRNYLDMMDREALTWDYLISPNEYSSAMFPRAFAYPGPLLETGYPRNDVLVNDGRSSGARVRKWFGIPDEAMVILYAPTWRDDVYLSKPGQYQTVIHLDVQQVVEHFGGDAVVLVRGHSNTLAYGQNVRTEGVHDVTAYPEISDLYSAADVLVTDYSSVMFDFAVTGKPILYLAPDFEDYRDRVRGFYFDFEQQAPGPILRTSDEVIARLGDLESVRAEYAEAYDKFRRTFDEWEDGHATERVIEAVFHPRD